MSLIEQKFKTIVSEQLNIPVASIQNTQSFKDLGADSLETVSLLIEFEEALNIEIADSDAKKIKTVQAAIDYATTILNQKSTYEHNIQV